MIKKDFIEKHFIPRQTIRDYQIGLQTGDILIEENLRVADLNLNSLGQKCWDKGRYNSNYRWYGRHRDALSGILAQRVLLMFVQSVHD